MRYQSSWVRLAGAAVAGVVGVSFALVAGAAAVAGSLGIGVLSRRHRHRVRRDVDRFRGARTALAHAAERAATECRDQRA